MPLMDDLLPAIGREVRRLRHESGASLRDLAARSRLSTRFLSEVEAGRANISVLRLASLADALGTSPGALLARTERAEAPQAPRPVALLGMRGAGKSTIGSRLAARLRVPFFELDALIEQTAGVPLADVFALSGEAAYRRLETDVLRRFLHEHGRAVLATGGGIVGNEAAFRLLRQRALTVWLRADPEDHWERVVRQGDLRPMAGRPAARDELRRLLESRRSAYARAHRQIDTSRLPVGECVRALARALGGGMRTGRARP